ncbi:ATP-binding protein [Dolichospermum circinale]|uniref:sensor histidine kinase n=1 Tax=Dolichospermum circinale TaxID=109265 RepID=UPI0004250375|nr:ATP-binding protein [Dolichospermum circinale]
MLWVIKYRLLFSYLLVFGSVLGVFTLAVRIFVTQSLEQEITDKLIDLAGGAAGSSEYTNGKIKLDNDFPIQDITNRHQGLQWFDQKRNFLQQKGENLPNLPLDPHAKKQIQSGKNPIIVITLPVISSENGKLIGYVRASESLENLNKTLSKLDWGLGGGIFFALLISGIGGVWLTRQSMQPIEESLQRLQQFTADASHELRSPLMAIKSNASVAIKYPEAIRETDLEKFQAILSATKQMSSLTEDLLFLARTDIIPNQDPSFVNLGEILDNLYKLYKPQAEAKQIKIKLQLDQDIYILGDCEQLKRLFTNLLENAINYTFIKGIIDIITSSKGSHIYVSIKDTGIGISPDNLEKVFDRFWRADESRSYNCRGSGLGLAIAQAIAKKHGGLITVKSELGVGSCFTVRLLSNYSGSK